MNARSTLVLLIGLGGLAGAADAEQACKMEQLKNPAPTLADMYAMAHAKALAWKSDAVPMQISNTSLGLLQPNGSAASWHILFYSPSAKSIMAVDSFRGYVNCSADPGSAGRIPDLKDKFLLDGARLYAIAKEQGGPFLAQGYGVMIGTAAAPGTRHATWNISYQREGGTDSGLLVLVDANTGQLEKVIK